MSTEKPLPEAVRAPWDNELERCVDEYAESDDMSVDYIRSLFVRVAEAAAQQERARLCTWTSVDDPDSWDVWNTTCGHAFQFNDGGPTDNHCQWCCYCGGKLVASHPPPTPEDR